MSLALRFGLGKVPALAGRVARLGDLDRRGLLEALGAEAESQVRRRIESEKRGPDGRRWAPWSPAYAGTRHAGQSLLFAEGNLADSIQHLVSGDDAAEIGSNLVYAAIHQFGGAEVGKPELPDRPYLGFSADNLADLDGIVDAWVADQLEAL